MYLLDTSVLFAYFDEKDTCHEKARDLLNGKLMSGVIIPEDIIKELISVICYKKSRDDAAKIFSLLHGEDFDVQTYSLNSLEFIEVMNLFNDLSAHKMSFFDCELLFLAKKYGFELLTFDKEINDFSHKFFSNTFPTIDLGGSLKEEEMDKIIYEL